MYRTFITIAFLMLISSASIAIEFSGRIGIESRYFFEDQASQSGILAEPEVYWSSDAGDDSFTLKIFARYDELDDQRTHADIREALWLHVGSTWEFRAGIGKVFWGVTESNHLVDIINQTDLVESADGEQKLGQPMLQYSQIGDWGVIDLFILPGFRERTFAGEDGRLAGPLLIDVDEPIYESSKEQRHVDYALRYSHSLNIFDLGLTGFVGTNRDPQFLAEAQNQPYYDQMQQLGLDVQATLSDWLIKLEAIYRNDSLNSYFAETAGFEYTFVNMVGSGIDLGVLAEYSHDSRDEGLVILDNDLFIGARLTFNDVQSTDLLIGFSQDLEENSSQLAFIEGSRRVGESFKLTLDARLFSSEDTSDPVYFFDSEDYGSITFEWYF